MDTGRSEYGHPADNFDRIARIWTAFLENILQENASITPEQVGWMMVGVKMSREAHAIKPDNLDDSIGYLRCVQMIRDERA